MKKRIRFIVPVATDQWNEETREELMPITAPDTELEIVSLTAGPVAIECEYEASLAAPLVVEEVKKAEAEGALGAVVDCFCDPGVYAAKEVVKIPVLGIMEAALTVAGLVANRYGILNPTSRDFSLTWKKASTFHPGRLVSIKGIDMPVLQLTDKEKLWKNACEVAWRMVKEDQAEAVVLGCGAMLGLEKRLQQEIGIPVIAPSIAGLKMIELLVAMNISHSKLSFPEPIYNEVIT